MANSLYVKGKEKILSAAVNFATDTLKVALWVSVVTHSASSRRGKL